MAACTNEDAEVVKLLVQHGADLHAQDGTEVSQVTSSTHMHLSHVRGRGQFDQ